MFELVVLLTNFIFSINHDFGVTQIEVFRAVESTKMSTVNPMSAIVNIVCYKWKTLLLVSVVYVKVTFEVVQSV